MILTQYLLGFEVYVKGAHDDAQRFIVGVFHPATDDEGPGLQRVNFAVDQCRGALVDSARYRKAMLPLEHPDGLAG